VDGESGAAADRAYGYFREGAELSGLFRWCLVFCRCTMYCTLSHRCNRAHSNDWSVLLQLMG
jgi:hypothetical protein